MFQIGFEVRTSPDGYRGAYATKDYTVGHQIALIPSELTIQLENNGGFPAEHAHALAIKMATNPTFMAQFSPYFSTLPMPNQTVTSEVFSDKMMNGLQSEKLKELVERERTIMAGVYYGKYTNRETNKTYEPIPQLLGSKEAFPVVLFAHLAAIISTREFTFFNEDGSRAADRMVPIVDMINTDADKLNSQQYSKKFDLLIIVYLYQFCLFKNQILNLPYFLFSFLILLQMMDLPWLSELVLLLKKVKNSS
jgi:hypothetical protein